MLIYFIAGSINSKANYLWRRIVARNWNIKEYFLILLNDDSDWTMMACISMYARLCKRAYHNISCILARVPVEETSKEIVTSAPESSSGISYWLKQNNFDSLTPKSDQQLISPISIPLKQTLRSRVKLITTN